MSALTVTVRCGVCGRELTFSGLSNPVNNFACWFCGSVLAPGYTGLATTSARSVLQSHSALVEGLRRLLGLTRGRMIVDSSSLVDPLLDLVTQEQDELEAEVASHDEWLTVPGLAVLAETVRAERALYVQHYEALDARAGVLLGFAGAILALAPDGWPPLVFVGTVAGIGASAFAVAAFFVRDIDLLNPEQLWDRYFLTRTETKRIQLILLILESRYAMEVGRLLVKKAAKVKSAVVLLAAEVLLLGLGVLVKLL